MYIDLSDNNRISLNATNADYATQAGQLNCGTIGSETKPVYFNNGIPEECVEIKTETLTINVNDSIAGTFDGSTATTINIDTISEDDVNTLLENYLPLSAGEDKKISGPLGLTENINYNSTIPSSGFEGEIFFIESNKNELYLPTGGQTGQILSKNSNTTGDVEWTTPNYLSLTGGTITGALNGTYFSTTNYGYSDPNSSTPGYGIAGALYFKLLS